jgi:hypothetical protein
MNKKFEDFSQEDHEKTDTYVPFWQAESKPNTKPSKKGTNETDHFEDGQDDATYKTIFGVVKYK